MPLSPEGGDGLGLIQGYFVSRACAHCSCFPDIASGNFYILMEKRLSSVYKVTEPGKEFEVVERFPGSSLVGKRYVPLFNYFYELKKNEAFRVLADNYVTDDSGTGIVHQAPAFGEDDYRYVAVGITGKVRENQESRFAAGLFARHACPFLGLFRRIFRVLTSFPQCLPPERRHCQGRGPDPAARRSRPLHFRGDRLCRQERQGRRQGHHQAPQGCRQAREQRHHCPQLPVLLA